METMSGYPILELFNFPSPWTENSVPHTTSLSQLRKSLKMVSATRCPIQNKSEYNFTKRKATTCQPVSTKLRTKGMLARFAQ